MNLSSAKKFISRHLPRMLIPFSFLGASTASFHAKTSVASVTDSYSRIVPAGSNPKDSLHNFTFSIAVEDDQVYPTINGNIVLGSIGMSPRAEARHFRRNQKRDFARAEPDVTDTLDILENDHSEGAHYQALDKRIHYHYFKGLDVFQEIINDLSPQDTVAKQILSEFYELYASVNDQKSLKFLGIAAHENTHRVNDRLNTYAPGLNSIQYAQLNQYDEISALLSDLFVVEHKYKQALLKGVPKKEALQIFDKYPDYHFYRDSLAIGINPESELAKHIKVKGSCMVWMENYADCYYNQSLNAATEALQIFHPAGMAIGNHPEFVCRIKRIFDSLDKNPVLQKLNIKIGKLSPYLPRKILPLSAKLKAAIEEETLLYTGMTTKQAQYLSKIIPGSQQEDAQELHKIFTGHRPLPLTLSAKKLSAPGR